MINRNDVEALHAAEREIMRRPIRSRQIELLDYTPTDSKSELRLAAPGTISVFFADKGAGILDEIRDAVRHGNGQDIKVAQKLKKRLAGRPNLSVKKSVAMLQAAPALADVRYGGLAVCSNMFVPEDLDVAMCIVPYNGGPLAKTGFTLVEHYQPEAAEGQSLDAVLVKASPPLSKAEEAALNQLSPDQFEINIGKPSLMCGGYTWATVGITAVGIIATGIGAVAIAAAGTFEASAVIAATGMTVVYGTQFHDPGSLAKAVQEQGIDLKRLKLAKGAVEPGAEQIANAAVQRLGPAATARSLLMLRADLLTKKFRARS
jgi:hypothetical protein